MIVSLRPFQVKLESDIYDAWNGGARNVMPVAATGSGKTVVLSNIMSDAPGTSVAIAHRQELVSQISIALARNGVRHRLLGNNPSLIRIISALQISELGYSYFDANAKSAVGGVDTVIRMDRNDPVFKQCRLMVQDESHHILKDNKWGKVAAMFPNARGLLPTATPLRADGRGLGAHADGIVDAMVLAPSMRDIINMGYLTDYRYAGVYTSDLDLSHVPTGASGDYSPKPLAEAVRKSHIVGDVVSHYLRLARGKLGVTFAVNVDEAIKIAKEYNANGVPAEIVSANTPIALRASILRRFKNREILQLVNVDLFGEGFDLPAIEVVSFARPTESFGLYVQQWGRALRLMLSERELQGFNNLSDEGRRSVIANSAKPKALIIDHVGNLIRHKLPDAPRVWSLDRRNKRASKQADDTIPIRVCANPECIQPYERTHRCCPHCGHYPEPAARSSPEYVDGDLLELDEATLAALRGEIARIDGDPVIPYGADHIVEGAVRKRHWERKQGQAALRNAIAWWAGLQTAQGLTESQSYRKFYFKFKVDVAGAQTLGAREAQELTDKINVELTANGIDGTVNAEAYFNP